jgi:hypothetical protein
MEEYPMKLVAVLSAAVLSMTLAAAAPSYARQEQQDQQGEQKDKPAKQDSAKQDSKETQPDKSAKQEDKGAQQQDKNAKQEDKGAAQQDKNATEEKKGAAQQDKNAKQEEKSAKQQDKNTKNEEKSTQQKQPTQQAKVDQNAQRAGSNGGGRIPEDRFKANFGQQHKFRVNQGDYATDHGFQYGGYSFGFVGAWPSNWLYTQDVFVVDIDGVYYLCNPMYPGVNVALSVVL